MDHPVVVGAPLLVVDVEVFELVVVGVVEVGLDLEIDVELFEVVFTEDEVVLEVADFDDNE